MVVYMQLHCGVGRSDTATIFPLSTMCTKKLLMILYTNIPLVAHFSPIADEAALYNKYNSLQKGRKWLILKSSLVGRVNSRKNSL